MLVVFLKLARDQGGVVSLGRRLGTPGRFATDVCEGQRAQMHSERGEIGSRNRFVSTYASRCGLAHGG